MRRKQTNEHCSLASIPFPSSQRGAGKQYPTSRVMWNSTFCSWLLCLFPLQEEDPDSDSEKLMVKETEDDDGE